MKDINTEHGEKFTFNENVSSCFLDMLKRSIPNHDIMRDLTTKVASFYMNNDSKIMDIGTSTGEVIHNLLKLYPTASFIGLEQSDAMINEAQERFKNNNNVTIKKHDLRDSIDNIDADYIDLIVSSLTIQFTPIEHRLKIIQSIYNNLKDNGVFLFIEKVLGSSAQIDSTLIDIYYDTKRSNGYSEEEIQRKRLALEGVLVPVTAKWNEELMKTAGFKQIDCFWRYLNFSGWVAIK